MMSIFKNALFVIVLCFIMGFTSITNAAESDNIEKRQLFERLVLVTNMQVQHDQIINMMVNQVKVASKQRIQQKMQKRENTSPEQKKRFEQITEDAIESMVARMMAAMKQEMPFSELVDRVYYPVYDKYFSASDLEAIIQFYESPAGKKYVSTTSILMQESLSLFNKLYSQKLQKIVQPIAEEELKRSKPELEKIDKEE